MEALEEGEILLVEVGEGMEEDDYERGEGAVLQGPGQVVLRESSASEESDLLDDGEMCLETFSRGVVTRLSYDSR